MPPEGQPRETGVISAELVHRFTYHPPRPDQVVLYQRLRDMGMGISAAIMGSVPDCRERSLALTKIEEAVMWANAAIARRS